MEIIKEIAEQVNPMIKLTIDTPCNYEDGKLPVLDVTVKVNKEMKNRIDFEFYEKQTKNPKVILSDSALSSSTKRTVLTQECLRRLRNTKKELGESVRNKHLNNFMLKLKNSGYSRDYRVQIVDSALNAFEKMVEDDRKGIKPLYRDRSWKSDERLEAKKKKKLNWFQNSNNSEIKYKSVLFVPPTPGGILAKEIKKKRRRDKQI
jgi:hypothetical protein